VTREESGRKRYSGAWGSRPFTAFSLDASPALLGVGYILGPRIAGYILGGAVLGWFVIIPAIGFFGAGNVLPTYPETTQTISQMSPQELYSRYLKYIGAGAVAVGGIIALLKSARTIVLSLYHVAGGIFSREETATESTERDIPFVLIVILLIVIACVMWLFPQVHTKPLGIVATLIAAFLFVTVSSRLVGLVGSSSNPISGMTIATLLGTSIVFAYFVGTDAPAKVAVLCVGAIVCIAIGVAGDCSQDLKTGFLLRATPWKQQLGEMIGVLASCIVVAYVIQLLHGTYGFGDRTAENPSALIAPQATIMKLVIDGVMESNLPWVLIIAGGAVAVMVELFGLPALPVAVGLYLPLGLSTPIMAGGIVRWLVDKLRQADEQEESANGGILTASGFVAGEGLVGVAMAGAAAFIGWHWNDPKYLNPISGNEELVIPSHLTPWLWQQMGWDRWHHWGIGETLYGVLPFVPFLLIVLWLFVSAARRTPVTPLSPQIDRLTDLTDWFASESPKEREEG